MGESITEGTILNWYQEEVFEEEGDILVVTGTDKVDNAGSSTTRCGIIM
jgi:hypothetical protein